MVNAQMVFESAMAIMDSLSQNKGLADTPDNREYKDRCLYILNCLCGELYPWSDNFSRSCGSGRPVLRPVEDFQQPIGLDDYICRSLLPYGLAAALLMSEDGESAAWCEKKYQQLKAELSLGNPAQSEEIEDIYGGISHGEFAFW